MMRLAWRDLKGQGLASMASSSTTGPGLSVRDASPPPTVPPPPPSEPANSALLAIRRTTAQSFARNGRPPRPTDK
jgi:hypothetical protein